MHRGDGGRGGREEVRARGHGGVGRRVDRRARGKLREPAPRRRGLGHPRRGAAKGLGGVLRVEAERDEAAPREGVPGPQLDGDAGRGDGAGGVALGVPHLRLGLAEHRGDPWGRAACGVLQRAGERGGVAVAARDDVVAGGAGEVRGRGAGDRQGGCGGSRRLNAHSMRAMGARRPNAPSPPRRDSHAARRSSTSSARSRALNAMASDARSPPVHARPSGVRAPSRSPPARASASVARATASANRGDSARPCATARPCRSRSARVTVNPAPSCTTDPSSRSVALPDAARARARAPTSPKGPPRRWGPAGARGAARAA